MKNTLTLFGMLIALAGVAQTNIQVTHLEVDNILKGIYDPDDYVQSNPVTNPQTIIQGIQSEVNPDSLKQYIIQLASFQTRNTGSDTLSSTEGIGAARNWVFNKFQEFSAQNEGRLRPAFLKFEENICGMSEHKNVLGVLPGTDLSDPSIIVIEGHMDSRCDGGCDIDCQAEGVEDNASGTALVIELARVFSKYSFPQTIVFMTTTGEEQGLWGAYAMSNYCENENIPVKAVLNNDVIGGVACGETSSAPSCPGLDDIDSTQVRLFSSGNFNSSHKQLARFVKLEYQEELLPLVDVPMMVTIMTSEDRAGRGGDHIPFRMNGFSAIRFTSANEHGDASNGPGYEDRQHTSEDILGVDTNNDQEIDSFFVDFNYLARNARINGTAATVIAHGPETPDFHLLGYGTAEEPILDVTIDDYTPGMTYRIALRSSANDWDSVYTTTQQFNQLTPPEATVHYVSVAAVDANGLESLFGEEKRAFKTQLGLEDIDLSEAENGLQLMQNRPNPFDESTFISVFAAANEVDKNASIVIRDLTGKTIQRFDFVLTEGMNDIEYFHGFGKTGTFLYSLEVEGQLIASKQMVFAN